MEFSRLLLSWYDPAARPMPWKGEKNPYFIWVSEVILHQTRVAQGWEYYQRFIKAFPTLESLAAASLEAVMQQWKGLGYYRRAEHLHAGARQVLKEYGGRLPKDPATLLKIKGIGPYSAAAIASFAWNKVTPAIDGNVSRIISRVNCIDEQNNSSSFQKKIKSIAETVIDREQPGLFNQAMMDLGATVCLPRNPKCSYCPIAPICAAYKADKVSIYPRVKAKAALHSLHLYYAVLYHKDQIWMRQRPGTGIYRNMYDFYLLESPVPLRNDEITKQWAVALATQLSLTGPTLTGTQVLSHRKLHLAFYDIHLTKKPLNLPEGLWYDLEDTIKLATPLFITKYLDSQRENKLYYKK